MTPPKAPTGNPILELQNVCRSYGSGTAEIHAVRNLNLRVAAGEFLAITGPSGSGKSTCLNIAGCLDMPTSGEFRLAGHSVPTLPPHKRALLRREMIGFVFQSPNLIGRMTAQANVELPLVYRGLNRQDRLLRANKALAAVGLANRTGHRPDELSGGQQQRVAIARAIVCQPKILIADEPTGALDTAASAGILDLITELNRSHSITVVLVTHDLAVAARADRICQFRDGRIVSDKAAGRASNAA